MTTLSPNSTGVFQVLPYLTSQEHMPLLTAPVFLKHFPWFLWYHTPLVFFHMSACFFLCKFLFLFYTLNILVFLGFGPSPQSSFLSSTFLGQSQPLSWHYHTYLNIRPTPAFFQFTIISWGSHLIFWPLKSPWITKCSLGEYTLACNDLIQCSYRSHLTELVRKERRKFNTDLEISSREIPSHLQILDVLVNIQWKMIWKMIW